MLLGRAILFSEMIPAAAWESEFNAWYDEEHIPLRMGCPGFRSAQRYTSLEQERGYLAVYELDSLGALSSSAYQSVKGTPSSLTSRMLAGVTGFTRYLATQLGEHRRPGVDEPSMDGAVLYAVWFDVPEHAQPEFDRWYVEDHIPTLLECEDWLGVRRMNVHSGEPESFTRLALHYLADASALDSDARRRARESPWRAELARQPWFKGKYQLFSKCGQRQVAKEIPGE